MEPKEKHIDDLFRQELEGYYEAPPESVWESLEQRLDASPAPVRRSPGGMGTGFRVLLAVLVATVSILLYRQLSHSDVKLSAHVAPASEEVPALSQSEASVMQDKPQTPGAGDTVGQGGTEDKKTAATVVSATKGNIIPADTSSATVSGSGASNGNILPPSANAGTRIADNKDAAYNSATHTRSARDTSKTGNAKSAGTREASVSPSRRNDTTLQNTAIAGAAKSNGDRKAEPTSRATLVRKADTIPQKTAPSSPTTLTGRSAANKALSRTTNADATSGNSGDAKSTSTNKYGDTLKKIVLADKTSSSGQTRATRNSGDAEKASTDRNGDTLKKMARADKSSSAKDVSPVNTSLKSRKASDPSAQSVVKVDATTQQEFKKGLDQASSRSTVTAARVKGDTSAAAGNRTTSFTKKAGDSLVPGSGNTAAAKVKSAEGVSSKANLKSSGMSARSASGIVAGTSGRGAVSGNNAPATKETAAVKATEGTGKRTGAANAVNRLSHAQVPSGFDASVPAATALDSSAFPQESQKTLKGNPKNSRKKNAGSRLAISRQANTATGKSASGSADGKLSSQGTLSSGKQAATAGKTGSPTGAAKAAMPSSSDTAGRKTVTGNKAAAAGNNNSASADSGSKPKVNRIFAYQTGALLGAERGFSGFTAQKTAFSVFFEWTVGSKWGIGISPAYKWAKSNKDYSVDNGNYVSPGSTNVTVFNKVVDSFGPTGYASYAFAQKFDSMVATKKLQRTYREFELPLWVSYHINKNWTVLAGIQVTWGSIPVFQGSVQTFSGLSLTDTVRNYFDTGYKGPNAAEKFGHNGVDSFSKYKDPSGDPVLKPVRGGYMVGLRYTHRYGISAEATLRQQISGLGAITDPTLKQLMAQPYFRISIGYQIGRSRK